MDKGGRLWSLGSSAVQQAAGEWDLRLLASLGAFLGSATYRAGSQRFSQRRRCFGFQFFGGMAVWAGVCSGAVTDRAFQVWECFRILLIFDKRLSLGYLQRLRINTEWFSSNPHKSQILSNFEFPVQIELVFGLLHITMLWNINFMSLFQLQVRMSVPFRKVEFGPLFMLHFPRFFSTIITPRLVVSIVHRHNHYTTKFTWQSL